jgi:hypothetical protein
VAAVDKKMILWTVVVFLGCSVLFRGIDALVDGTGMSLLIQALVMVAIIGTIVLIARLRR